MLEPVSVGLKFAFLIVLYLFLLWVSRSALKDLRRGVGQAQQAYGEPVPAPADATGLHSATSRPGSAADGFEPRLVVERAPGHTPGMEYEIGEGAVMGRGDQAEIRLDDPFASSQHAKLTRHAPDLGKRTIKADREQVHGQRLQSHPALSDAATSTA